VDWRVSVGFRVKQAEQRIFQGGDVHVQVGGNCSVPDEAGTDVSDGAAVSADSNAKAVALELTRAVHLAEFIE